MSLNFSLKKRLQDFSLDIELHLGNEIAVLFGPSGSGKTITLKMLSGIIKPDRGMITINGRDIFNSEKDINVPMRSRKIGYLFQEHALFPHMTVFENIECGILNLPKTKRRDKVLLLLDLMRLAGLENRYPAEISGGQRQRTALARTLAVEPDILLLDEPFSALDNQVKEKLRQELISIHERYPITTLLVTHDTEEAFMLGERIAVINNGRLEQFGKREDVFHKPSTKNVAKFMGARNIFSGTIKSISSGVLHIDSDEIGSVTAGIKPLDFTPTEGQRIYFGIRPEEVMIIRPDKPLDTNVQNSLIRGVVTGIMAKGTGCIVYFASKDNPEVNLKIDIPNIAFRRLCIEKNKEITVSLKKECIWVIKED